MNNKGFKPLLVAILVALSLVLLGLVGVAANDTNGDNAAIGNTTTTKVFDGERRGSIVKVKLPEDGVVCYTYIDNHGTAGAGGISCVKINETRGLQ